MDTIKNFVYTASPSRVIFGSGTVTQLPVELTRQNLSSPLILTTPEQAAQAESLSKILNGNIAGTFSEAAMHTPLDITNKAVEYAKSVNADSVVSIGGGSTTGLGKAIMGETTEGRKTTRSDPKILPGTVIYDVDFTMTLPLGLSATSGVNAIAHAALEGIKALATSLPTIIASPSDITARTNAQYGAWLCGVCLGSVGMALHHKICHTLGGSFSMPHAETHTIVLPHALAYNTPKIPEAMKKLAEVLPESDGDAIRGLNVLLGKLGVKRGLKEFGFKEEDVDRAADIAVANPYWNPRPVEREAIRELIRRAVVGEDAKADF
ncbi:hypothetical protein IFR05_008439 [Cadophora sp. M221]|nr:hypothetical protein IFR05_008439 [Cadophora sp. M221]